MRLLAPAKINLHLRVGPPRADGFHPLVSWMCTVGLFDNLEFAPAEDGQFRVACDDPAVPVDERNLVVKAAAALAGQAADLREGNRAWASGLTVRLRKRIPVGAGLGGGSSDGACTLRALDAMWRLGWGPRKMADFAARFGSDLSFFFFAPSAICRGRGELVEPIAPPAPRFCLLLLPGRPMPTPQVYRQFDRMQLGRTAVIEAEPDFNGWLGLPAADLLAKLVNDLEPAAFALDRELGRLREDAERQLGRAVRMSGSGSSLFTLYDSENEAVTAAELSHGRLGVRAVPAALAPVEPVNAPPGER